MLQKFYKHAKKLLFFFNVCKLILYHFHQERFNRNAARKNVAQAELML